METLHYAFIKVFSDNTSSHYICFYEDQKMSKYCEQIYLKVHQKDMTQETKYI